MHLYFAQRDAVITALQHSLLLDHSFLLWEHRIDSEANVQGPKAAIQQVQPCSKVAEV